MDAAKKINCDVDDAATDDAIIHTDTAFVITPGLSPVTLSSITRLFNNELVTSQLKDTNKNNNFDPYIKLFKSKVSKK